MLDKIMHEKACHGDMWENKSYCSSVSFSNVVIMIGPNQDLNIMMNMMRSERVGRSGHQELLSGATSYTQLVHTNPINQWERGVRARKSEQFIRSQLGTTRGQEIESSNHWVNLSWFPVNCCIYDHGFDVQVSLLVTFLSSARPSNSSIISRLYWENLSNMSTMVSRVAETVLAGILLDTIRWTFKKVRDNSAATEVPPPNAAPASKEPHQETTEVNKREVSPTNLIKGADRKRDDRCPTTLIILNELKDIKIHLGMATPDSTDPSME